MEFLALFENQILPYLDIEYCLIWKWNNALFESCCFFLGSFLYSIYTPYLKLEYCLIWTVMFFLNLFLIVSTRRIWKLNIALFEPWCFLEIISENIYTPYLKLKYGLIWTPMFFKNNSIFFVNFIFHNFKKQMLPVCDFHFLFCDPVYVSNQTIFTFQ